MVEVVYDDYGNKVINEEGSVRFKCPACGKGLIVRSRKGRLLGKEYKCPNCGFIGP